MSELDKLRAPLPSTQLDRLKKAQTRPTNRPAPSNALVPVGLQPLSQQLIETVLDHMEASYERDDDGDTFGVWDNGFFYFFDLSSETDENVFQIHARWEESLAPQHYADAALFANEWNSSQGTPTAFAREEDDGIVGIYGEVTVGFGPGVTLEQLERVLEDGIAGALALFDAATSMFTDDVDEVEVDDVDDVEVDDDTGGHVIDR
ncbi:MAG TPA: YbjN domain-containing protein [Jiangellaceae bacterium]